MTASHDLHPAPTNEGGPVSEALDHVARGAHEIIDRLTTSAAPGVQRLDDGLETASAALQQRSSDLRAAGEEWMDLARNVVREHPLATLAAALALGMLLARAKS